MMKKGVHQRTIRVAGCWMDHQARSLVDDQQVLVFEHDGEGDILGQDDGPPGGGQAPVRGWLPGEYVTDERSLRVPPDLADGEYRLGVGFYDPVTGVRLGERVILDTPIPVSAGEG